MKQKNSFVSLALFLITSLALAQSEQATLLSNGFRESIEVDDYSLLISCIGEGSPTVFMAAGTGPYGAPTFAAVQPEIATITRTCVYTLEGQPSEVLTGQIIARDWHTLLTATNVQGPYVIVGGSWAGFPAKMFAYEYPDEVVGMVLIDALHEEDTVQERAILASYDDNQAVRDLLEELAEPIFDYASFPKSEEEVRAARLALGEQRLLGDKPLIVLTPQPKKDEEWSPGLPEELSVRLRDNWVALQKNAATLSSNSLFIVVEDTGHTIQQDRPEVIIDAIRKVVEAVKTGVRLEPEGN